VVNSADRENIVAKAEDLKEGVEVWIKEPAHIYAEVIGPRPGDAGLPPEEVNYMVRIQPNVQYLPAAALELSNPPKDPNAPLKRFSQEWLEELKRCRELAERSLANPSDKKLISEALESMKKLGWVVPR
jgi:hypothetical protein